MRVIISIIALSITSTLAQNCATRSSDYKEFKEIPQHVKDQAQIARAHDKIIGCYVGMWAFYRTGPGKFDVDDIDPNLCTHGFYGFADLDNSTWTIKIYDPWYDQHPDDCAEGYCCYDSYRRFIKLKDQAPDFVPMISIGGWNAGSGAYSVMAGDPAKRKIFVDSISDFLDDYPFDGVDLDWEYPGQREGSDPDHDRQSFSDLVAEMSVMLKNKGKLFSAALSPAKKTVEQGYDLPFLTQHFDFFNVMTYDYHGWFPDHFFTGHNAPIYGREEEKPEDHPGWYFNQFDSLKVYLDGGVPKNQLVMGMPFYGRGFVLNDTQETGLYCGAHAGIPAGPYTRQDGIWGYYEILQAQNNQTLINLPNATAQSWTSVTDDCYQAPYMFNGPYWIGYDDPESIKVKAKFANFMELAGSMVWSMDTDDFRGDFGSKFPMMHAIHDTFISGETFDPENPKCTGTAPMCTYPPPNPNGCTEHMDVIPYPGDCHKYFMCISDGNGGYNLEEYTCGDWIFDPNIDSCTDPSLPNNDYLCE